MHESKEPNCSTTKIEESSSKSNTPDSNIISVVSTLSKKPGIYTQNNLNAAGFQYTGAGDAARCKDCGLEVSNWTATMHPYTIHSKQRPECPFILSLKQSIIPNKASILSTPATVRSISIKTESENRSKRQKIEPVNSDISSNTLLETNLLKQVRRRTFSHWPLETLPTSAQMIQAGFFSCNVDDRVICIYCNLICQQWTPHTDDPSEVHKTLSPNCIYVAANLIRPAASSTIIVNENSASASSNIHSSTSSSHDPLTSNEIIFTNTSHSADTEISKQSQQKHAKENELKGRTFIGISSNSTLTINSQHLSIPDESTLSRLVAARLELPISQRLLDKKIRLSIIKRCWEDQLRLKQNAIHCMEDRNKTIEREQSFTEWPHLLPSPVNMVTSGWFLDKTKSRDHTICQYCNAEYHNWQREDNPEFIHNQLSASTYCPFLLFPNPMHPSSVPIKPLQEVITREIIANEKDQPTSHIIAPSFSLYADPLTRRQSFSEFPGGPPQNMSALVQSGFYFTGNGTILQCYNCSGTVNDLHRFSSNDINTQHCSRFSHCHFAQLLPKQAEITSANDVSLCKWCLINPNELIVYSCNHRAVCKSCAQVINTCPVCGIVAKVFMTIPM
ncbi:unnamed protein product [Adineta steineri]|uniref:RING-type domain-containing protein n=1 Tax=Adineta steineri TaxID=433720 RepID=A0A819KFE6_9BILA|nr:unnamed protein product [Adineta steineri]CAF1028739.1 unnamed protein product [Adineta steineri]CAF3948697.1 unnamed protein product [Adineta steineri]CAF3948749.1 unnamed protein product [Adineta steineri]CAF4104380.1 unnamed protein product [Adineta steineri]